MTEIFDLDRVSNLIKRWEGITIQSTGARVTEYSGVLYNVSGSTDDPKSISGLIDSSWLGVLRNYGIKDEACYVTSPLPEKNKGKSHPLDIVGGHMTEIKSGKVPYGSHSYLMPLCKWHNNPARNTLPFEHEKTTMVKLTGYMQGELAQSFLLRMPSEIPMAMLYYNDLQKQWKHVNLSNDEVKKFESDISSSHIGAHVLFEREHVDTGTLKIKEVNLPETE